MKKRYKILIAAEVTLYASLGSWIGMTIYNQVRQKNILEEKYGEVADLLSKTRFNLPISADVDNPIGVIVQNANLTQKQDIVNTLNQITEFCPNIKYTLLDDEDIKIESYVNIYANADVSKITKKKTTLGLTKCSYSNKTAKIVYPVNIYIDSQVKYLYDEEGVSLFSFVLKHELMHSLGFADLYDASYLNKSIMYHQISPETEINDFTSFDIKNINKVYSDYNVQVEKPTMVEYVPYTMQDEMEL